MKGRHSKLALASFFINHLTLDRRLGGNFKLQMRYNYQAVSGMGNWKHRNQNIYLPILYMMVDLTDTLVIIRIHCMHHLQSAKMQPLATDIVWVSLCVCVCLLDATVNPAKTDEPIEMLFGLWTRVGPRNHMLNGAWIPHPRLLLKSCPLTVDHSYYSFAIAQR